jgi:hypothetical protein
MENRTHLLAQLSSFHESYIDYLLKALCIKTFIEKSPIESLI